MAMRTAAKSISRRLFSGACHFSEKAKIVENLHPNEESPNIHQVIRQLPQLKDEVMELSAEIKSLRVGLWRVVEIANSNGTYLEVSNTTLYVLGGSSAIGGYIYGTCVKDEIATDSEEN